MRTERMNIFGDDLDENRFNSTEEDETVFYSDIVDNTMSTSKDSRTTNTSTRHYGYTGRAPRNYKDYQDDYEYEDAPVRNTRTSRIPRYERHVKVKPYEKHLKNYQVPSVSRYDRYSQPNRYSNNGYNSNAPQFSKEQNDKFVSQLIAFILVVLAVIFIIKGDSAYAGVTAVILIIYGMGALNSNKKGSNRK